MNQKTTFIASLVVLVLLGLVFAAWQAGSVTSDSGWQKPIIQASASTPTLTVTPGWWETPVERPVVPTMPHMKATITPIPETPRP